VPADPRVNSRIRLFQSILFFSNCRAQRSKNSHSFALQLSLASRSLLASATIRRSCARFRTFEHPQGVLVTTKAMVAELAKKKMSPPSQARERE